MRTEKRIKEGQKPAKKGRNLLEVDMCGIMKTDLN